MYIHIHNKGFVAENTWPPSHHVGQFDVEKSVLFCVFRVWELTRRPSLRSSAPETARSCWRSRRFTKRVSPTSANSTSTRRELRAPKWRTTKKRLTCTSESCSSSLNFLPSVFKKELDKDVAGDTSGNFAKLLLALVQVDPPQTDDGLTLKTFVKLRPHQTFVQRTSLTRRYGDHQS